MHSGFTQHHVEELLQIFPYTLFGEQVPRLGLCSVVRCVSSALNYPQPSYLFTYNRMDTHPYCDQNSSVFFNSIEMQFTVIKMYAF